MIFQIGLLPVIIKFTIKNRIRSLWTAYVSQTHVYRFLLFSSWGKTRMYHRKGNTSTNAIKKVISKSAHQTPTLKLIQMFANSSTSFNNIWFGCLLVIGIRRFLFIGRILGWEFLGLLGITWMIIILHFWHTNSLFSISFSITQERGNTLKCTVTTTDSEWQWRCVFTHYIYRPLATELFTLHNLAIRAVSKCPHRILFHIFGEI